jgi:integral membrane protein
MSGALTRYRVMAVVVSIALFVLLFGMVLRYGFDYAHFSEVYSPIHGALYIVYLVTVVLLAQRARWSLLRTVGVMVAGAVPVLSYVVERRVVRDAETTSRGAA